MKKIFALLLIAALALTVFTACSSETEDPAETTTTAAVADNNPTDAPTEETDAPNAPAGNLEDLIAEQNASLAEANAASGGMYSIEVKADGDKLVYAYTYAMDLPAEALQASLDAAAEGYAGQVAALNTAGYDISAIVVQFLDKDGKELASKEFN